MLFGLEYLHAQGVLHRDIKGANILTTKTGVAKVADFGVSTSAANFESIQGTPNYFAWEMILKRGQESSELHQIHS